MTDSSHILCIRKEILISSFSILRDKNTYRTLFDHEDFNLICVRIAKRIPMSLWKYLASFLFSLRIQFVIFLSVRKSLLHTLTMPVMCSSSSSSSLFVIVANSVFFSSSLVNVFTREKKEKKAVCVWNACTSYP